MSCEWQNKRIIYKLLFLTFINVTKIHTTFNIQTYALKVGMFTLAKRLKTIFLLKTWGMAILFSPIH